MDYKILTGDSREKLKQIPDNSIDCCVTSPPYYGLRDYGGVKEQIGHEKTPDEFIAELVKVFEEVRRVLKPEGTLWINIGDTYAGSGKGIWANKEAQKETYVPDVDCPQRKIPKKWDALGIKNKDLIGIPFMLAFALRDAGWYLRQDIIWNKPNCMPASVKDRCVTSHEYIFLLSKSAKYYFNHDAMLEPAVPDGRKKNKTSGVKYDGMQQGRARNRWREVNGVRVRTKRSVWNVNTKPYKEAHFATYPPELIEPCILAGCPEGGTVLDPFGGSGTTAGVAIKHGRNAILCELNEEYVELIESRILTIADGMELL